MRGLHGTLATERGITGSVVATALGHESARTTFRSYAKPEAVSAANQRRALRVLLGGRSELLNDPQNGQNRSGIVPERLTRQDVAVISTRNQNTGL